MAESSQSRLYRIHVPAVHACLGRRCRRKGVSLCKLFYTRCARCSLASTLWLYANKFLWEYIVWERRTSDILFRFMSSYEPTRDGEIIPREGKLYAASPSENRFRLSSGQHGSSTWWIFDAFAFMYIQVHK